MPEGGGMLGGRSSVSESVGELERKKKIHGGKLFVDCRTGEACVAAFV